MVKRSHWSANKPSCVTSTGNRCFWFTPDAELAKRVAVGMRIAPPPPHRSVRALFSAYGSYLGYERRSVAPAKDAARAVVEAIAPAGGEVVPSSAYASDSGASDYAARIG